MSGSKSWVVGSSPSCDIVVTRDNVSRNHCRLILQDGRFFLEDLESTNGTYVNGVSVSGRAEVTLDDDIRLGSNVPFPWPDEAHSAPPPPSTTTIVRPGQIMGDLVNAPTQIVPPSSAGESSRKQVRVGRSPSNDLVLDYPMVSSEHAILTLADGHAILEDLKSTNGTAINDPNNTITRHPLEETDVVFFGSLRVPAAKLLSANPNVGSQPQETFSLIGKEMIFGRSPDCDQVLDYPMVSWEHARIYRLRDQLMVEDLQSANGTFVNGSRIHRATAIHEGDSLGLGSYTFTLGESGKFEKRDYRGNLSIEARDIAVAVAGKTLIQNVSLTIYPSEFVGLMGPSGAGKTTLMNALNGYSPPTSGTVLFNGRNLYAEYDQFASSLGYVPQDDIIHQDLTVGQALYFTAKMRLPPDTTDEEIENRIARVMSQLGLESTRDVIVGSPDRKGISGGQRKRVNLAMELLTDPSVLFLDEPTSGLSSEDALRVMQVLRDLANSGKAILLTIHQPSLESYKLMDNLVLLGKDANSSDPGELVYYGPAYPDAVRFFNPQGVPGLPPGVEAPPDAILRGLAGQSTSVWVQGYRASPYKRDFVTDRAGKPRGSESNTIANVELPIGFSQWMTLVRRNFLIKLKDLTNTSILLAQAPIVAFLVVLVFGQDASQTFEPPDGLAPQYWADHADEWQVMSQKSATSVFLMGLAALWFGCSNAVREIVGERAIYVRERMVNLKLPSYLASKFTVLGCFCLLQCLTLTLIVQIGCGLRGNPFGMLTVLLMVSLVGVGIGLIISALAKTSEIAIALLPIVLLPMVILGGMMQPIYKMPGLMGIAADMVPSRWAFESLVLTEAASRAKGPPILKDTEEFEEFDASDEDYRRPDLAQAAFPETERLGAILPLLVLLIMLAVAVGINLFVLRLRDIH